MLPIQYLPRLVTFVHLTACVATLPSAWASCRASELPLVAATSLPTLPHAVVPSCQLLLLPALPTAGPQDAMLTIHVIWGCPAFMTVVLVLLWFEVGWATFVGLGVMLALVPATGGYVQVWHVC